MKERLTGAIILVALVVLLVPELLTGPVEVRQQPQAEEASSSEGPPLRSYTIDLADGSRRGQQPAAASPELPRPQEPAPQPQSGKATEPQADETPKPQGGKASEPQANETPKPQAGTAPKRSAPVPERPSGAAAASADAPAGSGRRTPEPAPVVTGWAVQVGSFTNRENADRLARDLRKQGYSVFITEGASNGRSLHRVRVGPQKDRAAAQALATRLRKAGRTTAIVPYP